MKYFLKPLFFFTILSMYVPTYAQSYVQDNLKNIKIDTINVRFSVGYKKRIDDLLNIKKEELRELREKNDLSNARRRSISRAMQKVIVKMAEAEKRILFIESEMVNIPIEVRQGIESALETISQGSRGVTLNIQLGSFNAPTHLQALWDVSADTITSSITVVEIENDNVLSSFIVTDVDGLAYVGGATGAFIRALDGRNDMVKAFSEKTVEVLYPEP